MTDNYIVNVLLANAFHRYSGDTADDIRDVLYRFYGEEDVSIAKKLIYEHYEEVIGPRPARQNRGVKTLKEKEVEDIMDAMKKIDHQSEINRLLIITMSIIVWPFWRYKWQNYWHQKCLTLQ